MVQVGVENYQATYDDLPRWLAYYHQITLARKHTKHSLLEVGVGNRTVASYLKRQGYSVTTVDFDSNLKPDVVADVRKLPFKDNTFDAALCCQVLEHIPFEEVSAAIRELARVARTVIVSVPYSCKALDIAIRTKSFPITLIKPIRILRIPTFWRKHVYDGQHYWELGKKGFGITKLKSEIAKAGCQVISLSTPFIQPVRQYFVLRST